MNANILALLLSVSLFSQSSQALFWEKDKAKPLSEDVILQAASSGKLKISSARLMIDNDAAFDSKLRALKSARPGETVRLAYYIYADDYTSSLFSAEVIKATQRGVKVKLLLDALMGVRKFDLLSAMERESNGNLDVRFFGLASEKIWRDSIFLTRPCPRLDRPTASECSDYKIAKIGQWDRDFYSQLLISSIFGRSPIGAKVALLTGQLIDLGKFKDRGDASPEEAEQLKELFQLLIDAKIKHDGSAMLKLALAMQIHGDQINPILNELTGRIPIEFMSRDSAQDWEHLTDYLHHKIIMVGEQFLQIGGRNIEDSYHMKANALASKYIFLDTDLSLVIDQGGAPIAKAYDDLFNFSPRVQTLKSMRTWYKADLVANPIAFQRALGACRVDLVGDESSRAELGACVEQQLPLQSEFRNLSQREDAQLDNMKIKADKATTEYLPSVQFTSTWKPAGSYSDEIDPQDLNTGLFAYIENVPYRRSIPAEKRTRTYGADNGSELKSGKGIHDVWNRGLQAACSSGRPQRVILHTAYLILPSNLMRTIAKMIDGTWDCRNVHVTFLTNSIYTTDLSPINVAALYQLGALFEVYNRRASLFGIDATKYAAQLDHFEYKQIPGGISTISLHTKVSVLGDVMIIGSANGDVRSYFMDTNNGFVVSQAPRLVSDYTSFVERILADPNQTTNLTNHFTNRSLESIDMEAEQTVRAILEAFEFGRKMSPERKEKIVSAVKTLGSQIHKLSLKILAASYIEVAPSNGEWSGNQDRERAELQTKAAAEFNRLLQLL